MHIHNIVIVPSRVPLRRFRIVNSLLVTRSNSHWQIYEE